MLANQVLKAGQVDLRCADRSARAGGHLPDQHRQQVDGDATVDAPVALAGFVESAAAYLLTRRNPGSAESTVTALRPVTSLRDRPSRSRGTWITRLSFASRICSEHGRPVVYSTPHPAVTWAVLPCWLA